MFLNSVPNPISLCILQKGFISQNIIDYCTWQRQKKVLRKHHYFTRQEKYSWNNLVTIVHWENIYNLSFASSKIHALYNTSSRLSICQLQAVQTEELPFHLWGLRNVSTGLRLLGYKTKCHLDSVVQKYISED